MKKSAPNDTPFPKLVCLLFLLTTFGMTPCAQPWTQAGSDIDGEAPSDQSGRSVSLSADGLTVAIGSTLNSIANGSNGHVRVYKLIGGAWTQQGQDIDGEAAGDQSGSSVSLSADGQTVAIGAIVNDGSANNSGHVRVYKLIGGVWTQQGQDIDGEASGDQSGTSVSLSSDGQTVAIGAIFNDGNGSNSGHVRVYKLIGGNWMQQGQDIDGEVAGNQSGRSVSLSADGQTVAIGSPLNSNANGSSSGHVRVYKLTGGVWTQVGLDIDGVAANDLAGRSVSLSSDGQMVAIGAIGNAVNGTNSGQVRVYWLIGGAWTQVGSGINGEAAGDQSGFSVSLSSDGQTVAIGAINNAGNGSNSGQVRVYKLIGGVWTQQGSDIDGEAQSDQSGFSVSLSDDGQMVAFGAIGNDGNGSNSGHVRVYQRIMPMAEINIKGNGISIADGDATPAAADNTDFGSLDLSGSTQTNTFTIENTGNADLPLATGSITVTGAHAADFTLSGISLPAAIFAGNSTTFTVTFAPSAVGTRTAGINIASNDSDEAVYDFAITGAGACPATGSVWYVNGSAAGGGNGASWDCAFQNLQDAVNAASSGHQIWVKAGTYKPTRDPFGNASPANPRDKTFYLKDGVKIYGGFNGTETLLGQRDAALNMTILSGDFSGNDVGFTNNTENAYHVVLSVSDGNATVLDGFTVRNGNADGAADISVETNTIIRRSGGGLYNQASSATISNCRFIENSASEAAGGMLNYASSPMVGNCLFSGNKASYGGGMLNYTSSPMVNTCTFSENTAWGGAGSNDDYSSGTYVSCQFLSNTATDGATIGTGGGFQRYNPGISQFTNCIFYNNKALGTSDDGGGAIMVYLDGSVSLTNCSFSSNVSASSYAGNSGAISVYSGASAAVKNCILWGDTNGEIFSNGTVSVTYSIVQGGFAGTGNLDRNPLYVSASDLHLTCSPAIDAGTATGAPATDLEGNARPVNFGSDMGAYEYQSAIPEVAVEGNATTIAGGDNTPSTTDGTDFGLVAVNGSLVRSFTIWNTGSSALTVSGISSGNGLFTPGALTPASPIPAGDWATFTVTFNPTAVGVQNATITINTSDCDENTYTFAVQGRGAAPPSITVKGNGTTIANRALTTSPADHTDFGSASVSGGTVTRIFTVENLPDGLDLMLNGLPKVEVADRDASDFTVTMLPGSPVAGGSSLSFEVTFDPGAAGLRTAILVITHNDLPQNPFVFTVHGTGL